MKKVLLVFLLMLAPNIMYAQFIASEHGLITEDNKDFYVVNIEGKTAADIYRAVNKYILSNFRNPDVVSNKMENEMINMHGVYNNAFRAKKGFSTEVVKVDMNLIMHFRDGRIRFDIPILNKMQMGTNSHGYPTLLFFSGGRNFLGEGDYSLFDKKHKIKDQKGVEGINTFIHNVICDIVAAIEDSSDNKDW